MFAYTDTKQSPWYVVEADDKKRARLNCIHHLLSMIPYEDVTAEALQAAAAQAQQGLRPAADERPDVRAPGVLTGPAPAAQARRGPAAQARGARKSAALGQTSRSGQRTHSGPRAWQMRRPCATKLTCTA